MNMPLLRGMLYRAIVVCLLFSEVESRSLEWLTGEHKQAKEGDARLVGGKSPSEGRVEVFHAGSWGTICDDDWGIEEAQVVCRQLGFRGAISAEPGAKFGQGSGKIWLDDLGCKGSESSLSSCAFKGWGVTDCSHSEDASVVCDVDPAFNITKSYPLDHSIELTDQLGELFDSGTGCDFTLTFSYSPEDSVEAETVQAQAQANNNKESVCVHRLVLFLYPKFVVINSSFEMEISSNCQPYIREFTRYLYTRTVTVTVSSMQCLHQLASDFGAVRLLEDIGRLFVPLLPEDTSFRTQVALFKYAGRSGDGLLRDNVLRYLGWNMEPLVASAQWKSLPEELLKGLLVRTDLVLPDEAWLLAALEAWVLEQGEAVTPEQQAALLGHLRFPMMTPEQLYEVPFTARLYSSHKELFSAGILQGFQFHALNFSVLTGHVEGQSEQFQSRIYTAAPWSISFNASNLPIRRYDYYDAYGRRSGRYGYESYDRYSPIRQKRFTTPLPLTYSPRYVPWLAEVFSPDQSCITKGQQCKHSFRLSPTQRTSVQFSNQLLLACRESYVFNVQEFKNNEAKISNDSMVIPITCPDDLTYQFVVRPQYV
ncbi:galectin-3-binding protein A-like [Alosa pseudoharengus]|uniref:galectin-3-binding protein A-like n=1 Tax=Alosa pseudoharengus TaxID=34774 RepID=UPI003F89D965